MTGGAPVFIVNPAAGGGRGRTASTALRDALAARGAAHAELRFTDGPGDAAALAEAYASAGADPVVAVGGDGTIHEVANGLLRGGPTRPALAVIPAGTGNDFARGLGIPIGTSDALAAALGGVSRAIDAARCGTRYFLGVAGAGFDARVAKAVNGAPSMLKVGALPFVYYTLREVITNRNVELNVALDGGRVIRQRTFMVSISNGRYSGGGMQLAPGAEPDDGRLDVCLVGDVSRWEVVRLLPKVFSGGHVGHAKVTILHASTIRIDGPPEVLAQADGELIGGLPLDIAIVPEALRVLVPVGA